MPLLLKHTPGEWDGTFALAVEKLVTDLLHDGPVEGVAVDGGRPRTLNGYDNGTLVFEGNETEDLLEIEQIEVA